MTQCRRAERPAGGDSEREAFEKWAQAEGYAINREDDCETYCSSATHAAWYSWQARAALSSDTGAERPADA